MSWDAPRPSTRVTALGKYRQQVVVQARTRVSNGAGGWTYTWATLLTLRGVFDLKSDGEGVVGNEVQAVSRGTCELLYGGAAITSAHRLKFGTRYFGILGIPQPEAALTSRRLLLNVEEREGES